MFKFLSRLSMAAICAASFGLPAFAHGPSISGGGNSAGAINTTSAGTLAQGDFSLDVSSEFVKSREFSDEHLVEAASLHIHAHSADYTLTTTLSGSYGITDKLMLSVSIPYVYRQNVRSGSHVHGGGGAINSVDDHGDVGGVGDVTLLGKYKLPDTAFESAILFGLKLPTGETDKKHDGEKLETEHQPGSGSWDPILGVAVTKQFGKYTVDASLVHIWATEGQEQTDLGNRAVYGIGISRPVGGEILKHHDKLDLVLELNGEWSGMKQENGNADEDSGGTHLVLAPGVRYSTDGNWAAHLSFGVPVANNQRRGHPDLDYNIKAGIGWSF